MGRWRSTGSRDALVAFIAAALVSWTGLIAITTQGLLGLCVLFGGSFAVGRLLHGTWAVAMLGAIGPFAALAVVRGLGADALGTLEGVVALTIMLFLPGYLFGEAARPPSDEPVQRGSAPAVSSAAPVQAGDAWSAEQMAIRTVMAPPDPGQSSRRAKAAIGALIIAVDALLVLWLLWGMSQITGP